MFFHHLEIIFSSLFQTNYLFHHFYGLLLNTTINMISNYYFTKEIFFNTWADYYIWIAKYVSDLKEKGIQHDSITKDSCVSKVQRKSSSSIEHTVFW